VPMDRGTPDLVRHCVAAVAAKDGDTERAFAICVSQLQQNGYLEPGTMKLTAAGRAKEKEHEAEPDAAKKLASYEKILKAARKEWLKSRRSTAGALAAWRRIRPRTAVSVIGRRRSRTTTRAPGAASVWIAPQSTAGSCRWCSRLLLTSRS
jgi:hypothetical protein